MASSKSSSYLLVAAFDFGTTYSGYAFSFRDNPLKIQTNQSWNAAAENLISLKTPTCVLLTPDKKFHSFGFEAENKYVSLAEDEQHHDWLFFRRFKMVLHNNQLLSRDTTIEDINGRKMNAMTIFSMSIKYLRDHLMATLNRQTIAVEETDILYVITLPAIWDDSAKQFMREAAVQAGIDTQRLKLALEPEAASLWCQTVTDEAKAALAGSGTKYMVVDLGGGTADITVHEKLREGTLKELHKASGGPWGGMYVDNNYLKWLETIFGKTAMDRFKAEEMGDYFDVLRQFETKKRVFKATDDMVLRISATLKELSEKEGLTIEDRLKAVNLMKKVTLRKDKMKVDADIIKIWFQDPVDKIVSHIKQILREPKMKGVNAILLVGGFGESPLIQETFQKCFPTIRTIVPTEPGVAVLKGAVRFGHEPTAISARVMQYTYGISVMDPFQETIHPESKKVTIEGHEYAHDVFHVFVRLGDTIEIGHEEKKTYTPSNMHSTVCTMYYSTSATPKFTTDTDSKKLGELEIKHPEGKQLQDKEFECILVFGDTEIIVKTRILKTGREAHTRLNCLN